MIDIETIYDRQNASNLWKTTCPGFLTNKTRGRSAQDPPCPRAHMFWLRRAFARAHVCSLLLLLGANSNNRLLIRWQSPRTFIIPLQFTFSVYRTAARTELCTSPFLTRCAPYSTASASLTCDMRAPYEWHCQLSCRSAWWSRAHGVINLNNDDENYVAYL